MIENKLGITSAPELAEAEERISKKKSIALFENGMLDRLEAGTFASLKAIHKYLLKTSTPLLVKCGRSTLQRGISALCQ